jgi:hypothetical protein
LARGQSRGTKAVDLTSKLQKKEEKNEEKENQRRREKRRTPKKGSGGGEEEEDKSHTTSSGDTHGGGGENLKERWCFPKKWVQSFSLLFLRERSELTIFF